MERQPKRIGSRVLVALTLLFILFGKNALCQEEKSDVAGAVKKAESLGVPTSTLNQLLSLGYQHQVGSKTMNSFIQILTEAQREGIPLMPFASKIEEGLAKRAPHAAIEQVLERKLDDFRFTRLTIQETFEKRGEKQTAIPPDYLLRLSESLACGISRESLRGLIQQAPALSSLPMLAMAVETVASLEQNQFDPKIAQQIALTGLTYNYFTPEKTEFARILVVAKQKGISIQKISSITVETIQKKGSLSELASYLQVTPADLSRGPVVGRGIAEGSLGPAGGRGGVSPGGSGPGGGPGAGGPGGGGAGGGGAGGGGSGK
ncbi:MAG: hypothetical protein ACUVWO_00150 [Thermodesulfobacteriota bacterium]